MSIIRIFHVMSNETFRRKKEKKTTHKIEFRKYRNAMKLTNASQQITLIMINIPNKWTLKFSSSYSRHIAFDCRIFVILHIYFALEFQSALRVLCDLFSSCHLLHDYFLQFISLLIAYYNISFVAMFFLSCSYFFNDD